MTPLLLFQYFLAVGGGLFVIALFALVGLFVYQSLLAWAKREPSATEEPNRIDSPMSAANVIISNS